MIGVRSYLQKADLALSDLMNDAGILVPAQARQFIRTLINESTIMPQATVVPMRAPTQLLEKIKFGSRVLRAGQEGQALSQADRAKPDLEKEELNAKLFKAEVRLNNEVLEDSIERNALRGTIMTLLAERIALDMDEVIISGDLTHPTDAFLAQFDGILVQAADNVHDNNSLPIAKGTFRDMLKLMPSEFLRNKRRMRFFVSVDTEIEYRDTLAGRETGLGDQFLDQDVPVAYSGVPLIDVPLFPETLGVGSDETVALLCDPKNINVGIWRQIQMETDKDISAGVLIVVATLRFDVRLAESRATVKAENIKIA